jgi:hypothetical protein
LTLGEFTGEVLATGGVVAACGHGVAGLLHVQDPKDRRLLVGAR